MTYTQDKPAQVSHTSEWRYVAAMFVAPPVGEVTLTVNGKVGVKVLELIVDLPTRKEKEKKGPTLVTARISIFRKKQYIHFVQDCLSSVQFSSVP